MITDRMFGPYGEDGEDLSESEGLCYGRKNYPDLIAAADRIDDPHIVAVRSSHGLHVFENCKVEQTKDIVAGILVFAFGVVALAQGRAEAADWLMSVVSACNG